MNKRKAYQTIAKPPEVRTVPLFNSPACRPYSEQLQNDIQGLN